VHYVYIIKNSKEELYYGCTGDLRKRFAQHNSNLSHSTKGSKWKLIYYEAYLSKKDAFEREKQLKYYGQALAKLKKRINNSLTVKS